MAIKSLVYFIAAGLCEIGGGYRLAVAPGEQESLAINLAAFPETAIKNFPRRLASIDRKMLKSLASQSIPSWNQIMDWLERWKRYARQPLEAENALEGKVTG